MSRAFGTPGKRSVIDCRRSIYSQSAPNHRTRSLLTKPWLESTTSNSDCTPLRIHGQTRFATRGCFRPRSRSRRSLSRRTAAKTRCRNRRIAHRWRETSPNGMSTSWGSISDKASRKSKHHRTCLQKCKTTNSFVFKLFQLRRADHCRRSAPEFCMLA